MARRGHIKNLLARAIAILVEVNFLSGYVTGHVGHLVMLHLVVYYA